MSKNIIEFPSSNINKRTIIGRSDWDKALVKFATSLIHFQSKSSLKKISARGWCYLIETAGFINKDQFDLCQDVINECRVKGILPIDFVAIDSNRSFYFVDNIDYQEPAEYLIEWIDYVKDLEIHKKDFEFWESQEYYIQMMVEKIDVVNLYKPTCKKYHIPIANGRGWSDKNSRWILSQRFKYWESKGKKCVLLYVADHDPVGLLIANKFKKNIADLINCVDLKGNTGWNPENLIVDRFAMTEEFITQNNITWIDNLTSAKGLPPNKKLDYIKDYIASYGERKVEANVLIVIEKEAIELLENTITGYIGKTPFDEYNKAVKEDQDKTLELMNKVEMKEKLQYLINDLEDEE